MAFSIGQATDLNRWRLRVKDGRHYWEYCNERDAQAKPQSMAEKYFLGLDPQTCNLSRASNPLEAARNCFNFYEKLQLEDGHWACEYGGPLFLIPGFVISMYVTSMPVPDEWRIEMCRYLLTFQNKDGGWGLHIEAESSCFGTVLNYVTLRILGLQKDHAAIIKARFTLKRLGTALAAPNWAKFWLSILNCYEWNGMNHIPVDLWLLPTWLPIHPWRWWCHTRVVFNAMGYLYGRKICKTDDLILELRQEIYDEIYENINWHQHRYNVSKFDLYRPHTFILKKMNTVIDIYYKYLRPKWVANLAERKLYELILTESELTNHLCIGPVNNAMHLICTFISEGSDGINYKKHVDRLKDFMWISKSGLMACGTNGVQLWDTALSIQALIELDVSEVETLESCLNRAYNFLDLTQIKDEIPHSVFYRHRRKGAWPFSTIEQGYTVSDCTAEALKSVLMLHKKNIGGKKISEARIFQAVEVLLSLQNSNGGFASYELVRAPQCIESLNPTEVFGKVMVEYSYIECTTSVVTALVLFRRQFFEYKPTEIDHTIQVAIKFIKRAQRDDGSWVGSWGIGFTYASLFATESLALVGETYSNSLYQIKACDFLIDKQKEDGGWGETYKSCELETYTQSEESQVVNTAWACISLINAQYPDIQSIKNGIDLILSRQSLKGDFPQEGIEGVFNGNCMISYPNYKFYFVIKALAMFDKYCKFKDVQICENATN